MFIKATAYAAAFTICATSALAGGLADELVEAPVIVAAPAEQPSSVNPTYIVVGVLAALLIAAAINGDDDDDDDDTNGQQENGDIENSF